MAGRRRGGARVAFAVVLILSAIGAVYFNSLSVPFVFDDPLAIVDNPTIRHLWPLTDVLFPPHGEGHTVEGRPVLNLSLALNYAAGGTSVRGYHVVNIVIHALAALTLFGTTRRALSLPALRSRFGAAALPLALIVTLLWSLHPLQTESVTYVVQRAEALVSLFYLLTLYGFVRAVDVINAPAVAGHDTRAIVRRHRVDESLAADFPASRTMWFAVSFAACILGMATKEVMVSAPLLVLLFDRLFIAGSFRAAWRQRGLVHVALFSTWLLLAALVIRTGTRGGTAGFGINVTPWAYALTQFEAVTRYVWLSLWPHPLVFDYGTAWVRNASDVLPYAVVLAVLIGGTVLAWRRCPPLAFLGVLFFAVLSPTSSLVPGNRQTLAEHRMYLPLAAVMVAVVGSIHVAATGAAYRRFLFAAGLTVAAGFGFLTVRRNADYANELTLYRDTVAKRPANGFARYNLARALAEAGRHGEAVREYEATLPLLPDVAPVHNNLANSLLELGRVDDARRAYETAVRIDPRYAHAHFNLGNLLLRTGDREGARLQFSAAVAAEPRRTDARENLGGVLLELGRLDEARAQFEQVLQRQPDSVEAHFGLGNVFVLQQRWDEAVREFETVMRLRPGLEIGRERLEFARKHGAR